MTRDLQSTCGDFDKISEEKRRCHRRSLRTGDVVLPRPEDATDILVWIDTSIMLADPLTKHMDSTVLDDVLARGIWNTQQPPAAVLEKQHKQQLRRDIMMNNAARKRE